MTRRRILTGLILLAAFAALIWFAMSAHHRKSGRRAGAGEHAVPVLTAEAVTRDMPVILDGVGTVQAYQTVTVQPQVGGKLLSLNFKEGQKVKKGDVLAKIDPTTYKADLEQAKATLAKDRAALANARLDLKRYAKLATTNYVSKQQADQARATVRQDEAQVDSDKAAVDSAQATLGYTSVVAPITGRTGIRQVDEGNIVSASSTDIVVLTQLQPIAVVFTLPSEDVARIRAADAKGPLTVRVVGPDGNKVLDTGHLEVINNQVDTTTGTIKLKAVLPNANEQLWPGQFVNVRLQVGTLSNATVVPVAAVQQGPNGAFVYGIDHGKATMRAITVAQQNETEAVIAKGVKPGETVITAGFGQLSDGAKVKVDQSNAQSAPADSAKASQSVGHAGESDGNAASTPDGTHNGTDGAGQSKQPAQP
ncbi:efflux RND transporter periplasmic adaptor subunit [Salinisphaera hydrothermalis]|uniref:Secretion protein HlyD n=1 Tax=Salinisphaera hydrothermalis (strain C41B8) TaxID=1304275 RepID=A0A084IHY4_SALHC|nr:efflux RND transporter periplasmic adaptor subunit [Salinisphaera hydrothermalis]KEZ76318.1 secretion protein HlyD [Salinisphaera hydrothermalis C41B8]